MEDSALLVDVQRRQMALRLSRVVHSWIATLNTAMASFNMEAGALKRNSNGNLMAGSPFYHRGDGYISRAFAVLQ
jgi:hypothetical protein